MKYFYIVIIFFFILLTIAGCNIEGKIDDARTECEEKISELLEGVEDICLTKEDLLELIGYSNFNEDADTCSGEDPQG